MVEQANTCQKRDNGFENGASFSGKAAKQEFARMASQMGHSPYSVFDSLIEGAQVIDRNWEYHYLNDVVADHGKRRKEELLGLTMMEMYPGIENTEVFERIQNCMVNGIPHQMENEFKFPDGSIGWFELSIQPVPEGVLVLSFDITRLKETESILADRLAERDKMLHQISLQKRQLEEFCQIVAHNLRAPLSNMQLICDLVRESESMEEKLLLLEKQKPTIDFLQEVFEELMEAMQARMDTSIKMDQVDLEKSTKDAVGLLQGDILKSGAVITTGFSKTKTVSYPKKYLDSIVFNLLSNALKYRSPHRKPEIFIRSYQQDGCTVLEVKDNGLGMDLDKVGAKLFKLRKTFHEHPDAKGFGLFITKTQVEAMGGNISVESTPGKGSTFKVQLFNKKNHEGHQHTLSN